MSAVKKDYIRPLDIRHGRIDMGHGAGGRAAAQLIEELFLAAFDAREPFPQIMSQALQRVYESCGWDPVSGAGQPGAVVPPAVPTLAQCVPSAES